MKILTLVSEYPSYEDGIPNTFVHKYLKALKESGIDVFVLLTDFRSARRKRKLGLSTYEYDGIKVYRYAFPCGPVPHVLEKLMYANVCKLYEYAKKSEGAPDVIHAHFGTMGYVASRLKEKYGIPYVITEHSSSLMTENANVKNSRLGYFFRGYRKCDKLVCVSNSLKHRIESLDPSLKPEVVPNILGEAFTYTNAPKYDGFTVASVGRLTGIKRFDILIRAVYELNKRGHATDLKIIGDGELKGELVNLATELGIQEKVEFTGKKTPDEICKIFNRSHVFALTSDTETFGVVFIEANACGLPAIASNCGGPSDIINESNGIIIPKNDVEALCKAILNIKNGSVAYDPQAISDHTKTTFGKNRIVNQYIKLYEEACPTEQVIME